MEFSAEFHKQIEEFVARATAEPEGQGGRGSLDDMRMGGAGQMLTTPGAPADLVLPGLEAGDSGLLAGGGGSGKSWLVVEIALGLALGWSWPWPRDIGWEARDPARVAYFSAEDRARHVHRRLSAIGRYHGVTPGSEEARLADANLDLFAAPHRRLTETAFGEPRLGEFTEQLLEEVEPGAYRLIILDPLSAFAPSAEIDVLGAAALVDAARRVAAEKNAAVLLVHHSSQAAILSRETGQAAARGHTALVDGQRWVATLSPALDPEQAADLGMDEIQRRRWVQLAIPKVSYAAAIPPMTFRRSIDPEHAGVLEPAPLPGGLAASSPTRGASGTSRGGGNGKKSSGLEPYGVHA